LEDIIREPNIGSQSLGITLRTPSFDNDLFDFYISMRPQHRLSAKIFRKVLIKLNKDAAMIPSGNFRIPLAASSFYKTSHLAIRKLLRHLTGNQKYRTTIAEDRTWPDRDLYLKKNKFILSMIEKMIDDDLIKDYLPFFEWTLIKKKIDEWKEKDTRMGSLLLTFLSTYNFLKKIS